jgi:hypothetical protein
MPITKKTECASNSRPVRRRNPLSILFTLCSWKCLRIFLRSNVSYASYCKLWLNLGRGHGSPAERKMAMVIGRPLLKLNASTRGPRS